MSATPQSPASETPAAQIARSARSVAAWLWANVTMGAFGVWVVGEVFRDMNSLTGACFLVPTSLCSVALLVAALLAFASGCRRVALAAAVLWLFPTFWLFFVENQWVRPRVRGDPAHALRLVHWNVGPIGGRPGTIAEALKPLNADIIVLSELLGQEVSRQVATTLGRDYTVCHVRQIAVIARGSLRRGPKDERMPSRVYTIEWTSPRGPLKLMAVDLPSRPLYSRQPWLRQVHERIAYIGPDLVAGDFNARRRSHWLGRLPRGYAHAYDAAGTGWCYSWPDGFPLWDIDQCILGPRIRAIRYKLVGTGASDHRLQCFDFSIAPAPSP
ncbi:MAG TPA: endonuclease/exonuclease/phosphatase family protein [Planctomycetota bacterium]|nr:endonuclease/exonuclease/phosphatase family protein [Planctomycetota bacterium]